MDQNSSAESESHNSLSETSKAVRKTLATNLLLLFLLIIWPLSSYLLMKEQRQEFYSKGINIATQIYLPTIFIQLFVFLLIFLVLRLGKEKLSSIGFKEFSFKSLFVGAIFWIGISSFLIGLSLFLQSYKFFTPPEVMHLLPRNQTQKILWVIMALSASFSEESAFRGFVLTRLNFYLRNWWLTILIASLSFSLGHLYQGPAGMIFAGLYGMFFSLLFLWRKSLLPCITAHFLQDLTPLLVPLS